MPSRRDRRKSRVGTTVETDDGDPEASTGTRHRFGTCFLVKDPSGHVGGPDDVPTVASAIARIRQSRPATATVAGRMDPPRPDDP